MRIPSTVLAWGVYQQNPDDTDSYLFHSAHWSRDRARMFASEVYVDDEKMKCVVRKVRIELL